MLTLLVSLAACSYSETVQQQTLAGKLIVPRAAATRPFYTPTGDVDSYGNPVYESEDVTDVRYIGPIYLGMFSGIDTTSYSYPHPSMGPVVSTATTGDTYPYGGTTVGRFDFACYERLACTVTTGRFTDYDDILDYFKNSLLRPVTDSDDNEITSASAFQQRCFDYYKITSDAELSFIGEDNLSFTENADGDFESEFTFTNALAVDGAVVWGFMDAPEIDTTTPDFSNPGFTTCDTTLGREAVEYNHTYTQGAQPVDILNHPSNYISAGDWVSDGTTLLSLTSDLQETEEPTVTLSIQVE